MQKGTILCVDDDENLQVVVRQYLESENYNVMTAGDLVSSMEKTDLGHIDVILLDLVLPDGEGLTLIPQFRTKTNAAIIVVSGKSDTTEKIVCLEMGADDYLTKPFEMRELSARIKAVMRRMGNDNNVLSAAAKSEEPEEEKITFNDGWTLDRTQYQLFSPDNQSADLTTGEFQLLEALARAPNRALSREQLFELTRDGEYDVYDRAIDIQIGRIRKKMQDENGEIIKTVRGIGYMFSATT